jgi:hypothetical protein
MLDSRTLFENGAEGARKIQCRAGGITDPSAFGSIHGAASEYLTSKDSCTESLWTTQERVKRGDKARRAEGNGQINGFAVLHGKGRPRFVQE